MTTQEAYETMRIWLTRPDATRAVAVGTDNQCMYLTARGNKCAIGCLLGPESLADARDEYCGVGELQDLYEFEELRGVDLDFLTDCQRLHDSEASWNEKGFNVRALDHLAAHYGLEVVRPLYVPRAWVEAPVLV